MAQQPSRDPDPPAAGAATWPCAPVPSVPGDVWHWQLSSMSLVSRVRSDLRARIAHPSVSSSSTEDADSAHLSPAEERALRLYAQGYSTIEVAERMDVGYETAKTYLRRVREKYARAGRPASRKSELIRRAAEDGLLE